MQCCKASSRETRCYAHRDLLLKTELSIIISCSKCWQLLRALTRLIVYVLPEISTHGATIDNIQNLLQEEIANKSHPWCAISLTLLSAQLQNMAMRFGGLCKLRKWKDYIMNSANSRLLTWHVMVLCWAEFFHWYNGKFLWWTQSLSADCTAKVKFPPSQNWNSISFLLWPLLLLSFCTVTKYYVMPTTS